MRIKNNESESLKQFRYYFYRGFPQFLYVSILLVATVLLSSCIPEVRIYLYNNTKENILVEVSEDRVEIPSGSSGLVPNVDLYKFYIGNNVYQLNKGKHPYKSLKGYMTSEYVGELGWTKALVVKLESDGKIWFISGGLESEESDLSIQPDGFPLLPEPRIEK